MLILRDSRAIGRVVIVLVVLVVAWALRGAGHDLATAALLSAAIVSLAADAARRVVGAPREVRA
ncbi:hypothetical protein [Nocardiopsis halophila]|uniref:hypothetical protein n=1 Tax=Nocardiopsis halophila TaxID=141692 RepID=UPI0003492015|nr:hypothetical protein [Nocardiopsis halophila]